MTATTFPKLQPLGFGELLDRAIRIYRKNFVPFSAIVAIIQTPLVVLQLVGALITVLSAPTVNNFTPGQPPTDPFTLLGPGYFVGQGLTLIVGIVSFFASGILYALVIRGTSDSYINNESVSIGSTFRKASPAFGRILLTMLFTILVGLALLIWFIIPCFGWISAPGLLVFGSWVIYPLILICCTLEGQGPTGSYRRAWDLSRRRFWWTLGFAFVVIIFGVAVTFGPSLLAGVGLGFLLRTDFFSNNPAMSAALNTIIQSLVQLVITILIYPIQIIGFTLMYFDLRVRTEGFDMALDTANTDVAAAGMTDVVTQAPAPERGRPITGKEIGYFCLLSIIISIPVVVLYGALFALMMAAIGLSQGGF
jgi:hypothetical protein